MSEIWKDVVGYEGLYQVSSSGRVKSMAKHNMPERILEGTITPFGYKDVCLRKNSTPTVKRVHRLVLQAFEPIENESKYQVDHINRDRLDNRLINLRWVTHQENLKNRVYKRKDKHMVFDENYRVYESYREAERLTGISANTIKNDVIGKTDLFRCNTNKTRLKFFGSIQEVDDYWKKTNKDRRLNNE